MKLNQLSKTAQKSQKRVGRGYGSGRGGHTAGRGQKGQKSRGKVPLYFEGTAMRKSLIRRLPMMPGKGKNSSHQVGPIIVNLKHLNLLKDKTIVNLVSLARAGIIDAKIAKQQGVKILGDGELKLALTVELPTSKSAAKKIVKAGGKVEIPIQDLPTLRRDLDESGKSGKKIKPSAKTAPAGVSLDGVPTRQKPTGTKPVKSPKNPKSPVKK
ncbi:50S ribosomal protein L15 [Patescibacteria group bacterium]|nr:50S ribosomal protein L15 [Patescibacteria group bacterium]MBU1931296.1 50S ribosomal protein L15 [Patescibacteria group bacterium]